MNNLYQFYTCRRSYQILLFLTDIVTFEQCLNDSSTGRRTSDAILFQCIPKFVVIYQFTSRLHSTKQSSFGVRTRGLSPFLIQIRDMRAILTFYKGWKYILLFSFFLFGRVFHIFGKNNPPSRFQNLFTGYLKFNSVYFTHYGGSRYFTIGIKHSNKSPCYQIEHPAFHIRQVLWRYPGRDNSMVISHFRAIKHLLRFG